MTAICILAHGRYSGNICDCIADLGLPKPDRSWYEPRPGSGLDEQGKAIPRLAPARLNPLLGEGPLVAPDGIAIDEARLFWTWGSLYLVDEGDGTTRWSLWTDEGKAQTVMPIIEDKAHAICRDPSVSLDSGNSTVLLLQDRERFGLGGATESASLNLRLLRRHGVVIGWTVTG
jgi:hypothetical protein